MERDHGLRGASVIDVRTVAGKAGLYIILVTTNKCEWRVSKTYDEFVTLSQSLGKGKLKVAAPSTSLFGVIDSSGVSLAHLQVRNWMGGVAL